MWELQEIAQSASQLPRPLWMSLARLHGLSKTKEQEWRSFFSIQRGYGLHCRATRSSTYQEWMKSPRQSPRPRARQRPMKGQGKGHGKDKGVHSGQQPLAPPPPPPKRTESFLDEHASPARCCTSISSDFIACGAEAERSIIDAETCQQGDAHSGAPNFVAEEAKADGPWLCTRHLG